MADGDSAMAAHQRKRSLSQCGGERRAERGRADQHVGFRVRGHPDLEHGCRHPQKPRHVEDRLESRRRHAERNERWRMTVHDRLHVGSHAVDFAVDVALQIAAPPARVDRVGVEIELHYIVIRDERGRHAAREQEAGGIRGMACAHVSEAVDDALRVENSVRAHQVIHDLVYLHRCLVCSAQV